MAIPTLSGSYIDQTYQRLVQTNDTGTEFADGLGRSITFGTTNTGSLLVTASAVGNTITFTKGDNATFNVTVAGEGYTDTGSLLLTASVSLNTITFRKGNGTTFPITVNTGSTIVDYVTTSSFNEFTSSVVSTSSFNGFTSSVVTTSSFNSFTSSINSFTASSAISASLALVTASSADSTITFTKGDGTTFPVTINQSFVQSSSDIILTVLNQSGAQINKGIVVRITGSNNSSDIPRIGIADWTNDNLSANTLGLVIANIANGDTGSVLTQGLFKGYNTDTPGWQTGQVVYLGANGSITGSAPTAPLHGVRLGQVVRDQSNNGSIYVSIDNGYELGELHDVIDTTTNSSYGDLLVRSGSVWINSKSLTGSYTLTGSINVSQGITGSLYGTASWTENFASASSYVLNSATSSFVTNSQTGSFLTTSSFNSYTGSNTSQFAGTASFASTASFVRTAQTASYVTSSNVVGTVLSASYALTASYALNGGSGGATNTGSLLLTASVSSNTITFTKGDGSTFPITVATGSGGGGGGGAAFPYTGSASISGSLLVDGNVGIGTTFALYQLDVNGSARLGGIITSASSIVSYTTAIRDSIDINISASSGDRGIRIYATDLLTSTPNGAAIQFFSSDHSVLPGQFYLDSGADNNAALIFRTTVTGGTITERMRVTSGGNIGIGTDTPATTLHVHNANGASAARFEGVNGYPIEIVTANTSMTASYAATIGSIGNGEGELCVKTGSADADWAPLVYQKGPMIQHTQTGITDTPFVNFTIPYPNGIYKVTPQADPVTVDMGGINFPTVVDGASFAIITTGNFNAIVNSPFPIKTDGTDITELTAETIYNFYGIDGNWYGGKLTNP